MAPTPLPPNPSTASPERIAELAAIVALIRANTTPVDQLAAIINASRIVANRLDFLRGLESLVFNDPSRDQLRERDQLHRIVADNTWLFGEEFSLAVDDQGLTEVLKAHCEQLGIAVLDNSPVTRVDGSRGIVDLMLSRVVPLPRADQREHLVVELKRPTVRIGQEELAQVESYAHAIIRDERFRNTQTTWHFWALSNDVDDIVAEKAEQPGQPEGLVTQLDRGRAKVWVRTWAQVLRGCSARLQFFQDKLNLRVDRDNGLEYLRETYSKYLPPTQAAPPKRSKAFRLAICERVGCSRPLEESRRHGSARRFCSPRCRRLAWQARRAA